MSFKPRYHGDSYRTRFYAAQETFARALLESIVSRNRLPLEVTQLGLVERPGIDPVYYSSDSNRFDYALVRTGDKAIVALIEVTGDSVADRYARILTEKIQKIQRWIELRRFFNIYVMYLKRSSTGMVRHVRWFQGLQLVSYLREGCSDRNECYVDTWIQGEKPYLFVKLSLGLPTRQFISILKRLPSEIGKTIPLIRIDELLR